jgi:hypothetical protein
MAVDAFKEGFLCGISDDTIFTKESVYNLYNELSVTTDKVLFLLTIDDPSTMTKVKETVITYLKKYGERTPVIHALHHRQCNVLGRAYQSNISFIHR